MPESYREKQRLILKTLASLEKMCADIGVLIPDGAFIRGEDTIRWNVKTNRGLKQIKPFIKIILNHPSLTVKKAAFPVSRKSKTQLKGFTVYLTFETIPQRKLAQSLIEDVPSFRRCTVATRKKTTSLCNFEFPLLCKAYKKSKLKNDEINKSKLKNDKVSKSKLQVKKSV
jgi:hypothetical protein